MDFKSIIAESISKITSLTSEDIYNLLETPPDSQMGDFAFPCFRLAKELKKAPPVIALELKDKLESSEFLSEIRATGPYLNFFVDKSIFAKSIITKVLHEDNKFGGSEIGKGKVVTIDYSSPNLAKHFHIGHLYTTAIGNSLYKTYKFLGYETIGINYIGDWGTQFGKLIVAYKNWGDKKTVEEGAIEALNKLYVKFHDEAEKNPELENEARSWLVKMQKKDPEAIELWTWFREIGIADIKNVYERLNITFDYYRGESYYNDKMDAVVDELKEKNLLVESEGAMIVDLEPYKMPPCLILRSDGGTLYPTRDIAAAFDRKESFNFSKSIYITDARQSLHFAQFFKVIELMDYEWAKDMVHAPYGLLSLEGGLALSSRKGTVVLLEDLFNEAVNRISEIIENKNPNLPNRDEVSEQVGVGALIFATLFNNRIKDVVFSWERILSFDGETGPYVQYSHARCSSIFDKANANGIDTSLSLENIDFSLINDIDSVELLKTINAFPDKVLESADKLEPYIISRHLIIIAQAFNRFYHNNPILSDDANLTKARLAIVKATKIALSNGLQLLGISAPEKM